VKKNYLHEIIQILVTVALVNIVAAGEKRKWIDGVAHGEEWKKDEGCALVRKEQNNPNIWYLEPVFISNRF
jgi:hypothetical protein